MKRRSFLEKSIVAGTALTVIGTDAGAASLRSSPPKGSIIHNVYFWLKKGHTAKEEKEFLTFFDVLKKLPGAKSLLFGKAAPTTVRAVTDNTFDYHLMITFDSLEAIKTYEVHPEHLKAAEAYSKYWEKVQVRDTILD